MPNPYDQRTFRLMPEVPRDRDIAFVGRLVTDKGADVLIDALAQIHRAGRPVRATIIGQGPEEPALRQRSRLAGLDQALTFAGVLQGEALAQCLNRHRILAVPSRWGEPFGIVGLEGAACGCVVVGTDDGGLPEAIGPCGPIVQRDDANVLAHALGGLLADGEAADTYRRAAPAHLSKFTETAIIDLYESIFHQLMDANASRRIA